MMGLWVYFCWQTEIMWGRERKCFVWDLKLHFELLIEYFRSETKIKMFPFPCSWKYTEWKSRGVEGKGWSPGCFSFPFLPLLPCPLHNRGEAKLAHRLLFHFIAMQLHPAPISFMSSSHLCPFQKTACPVWQLQLVNFGTMWLKADWYKSLNSVTYENSSWGSTPTTVLSWEKLKARCWSNDRNNLVMDFVCPLELESPT